jgi:hypothetical protein
MKTHRVLRLVWFAVLGVIFSFSSLAYAAGDPLVNEARDQLHAALNPGDDGPPSNADKTKLLKSAQDLLKKAPGVFHGQRQKALQYIKSALFELGRGDPDQKADDYIQQALNEVISIT